MTTGVEMPTVAIAGASGFVGSRLMSGFAGRVKWIGLTRSANVAGNKETDVEWRRCDLFSLPQVETALHGADLAIYLVHSMLPSSRLVQGDFRDMDMLLADNFGRAAKRAGIAHIIYLGGLIPEDTGRLSRHLASRLEVESVLRESGVTVTVLRAGLIVGPGGSSTRMLVNLVRRMPVMALPRWTFTETQSIDIRDVLRAFRILLDAPDLWGGTYDLAGHPVMTYRDMIRRTSKVLGKRRMFVPVPLRSVRLSSFGVCWVSGVSSDLVHPLVESLGHALRARPNPLLDRLGGGTIPFEQSILDAVDSCGRPVENPRSTVLKSDRTFLKADKRVRSVQRMPLPRGWDAARMAEEYGTWLTSGSFGLIDVERDAEGVLRFFCRFPRVILLELAPTPFSRTGSRRRAFYITGGLLARRVDPPGRFEFRLIPELSCAIAGIHGFAPSLPWQVYAGTQALAHLFVMRAFARHLKKL